MREELDSVTGLEKVFRITPACAGRMCFMEFLMGRLRDHPRMCGKNRTHIVVRGRRQGSPPRMREESSCSHAFTFPHRITPAHAGRMQVMSGLSTTATGSPPRMREEFHLYAHRVYSAGITPAHAGRIAIDYSKDRISGDHPRACGKNSGRC